MTTSAILPLSLPKRLQLAVVGIFLVQIRSLGAAEGFSPFPAPARRRGAGRTTSPPLGSRATRLRQRISADDDYYGGFDTSQVVREFSLYEQLEDIVDLASKPLPERPDGVVAVAKFTSADDPACRAAEASYERLARGNPATIFLRCFRETEGASSLFQRARVEILPCFDVFYGGNRVARVDGPRYDELEAVINRHQLLNSDLDLLGESAIRPSPWGEGSGADFSKTPRTTAAFIPGYDWNKKGGFFDELADDMQKNTGFDFEKSYEEDWMPRIDD